MAESWKEACWKAERELEEYKGTIVPALVQKVKELEEKNRKLEAMNERQGMVLGKMHDEVCFLRRFVHDQGLDMKMTQAWLKLMEREEAAASSLAVSGRKDRGIATPARRLVRDDRMWGRFWGGFFV